MNIGSNVEDTKTHMSTMHDFDIFNTTFIPKFVPRDTAIFNDMITHIKESIGKNLSDDEVIELEGRIGSNTSMLIAHNTTKWSSTIYEAISEDNVKFRRFTKDQAEAREALKDIITQSQEGRQTDREENLVALQRAMSKITSLQLFIETFQDQPPKTDPIILTKHEQQRAANQLRYTTSMDGLEKIAKGLNDTSTAIRHYSDMEIECSSKLYNEMKLVSLESISLEDGSSDTNNLKLLKVVQERIADLGKVYESLVHCIRGILSSHYTITNSVGSEKTLSLLSNKEFHLPNKLDDQPSPIIAQVLISSIRSILHSCPKQTWALHGTLERIFVDVSKSSIHWSPIQSDSPEFTWTSLKGFYDTQNKSLYEILERRDFNAVHKSFHTLITGDIDDRGGGANTRGGRDDAVATIAWWIRYHTRSGFKDRQKIKDVFNHAFGPLGDGDIQSTIDKLRKLIPSVRRLGIKLSYESVVTQSVNVLQSRHPSFISSLEEFKRVPHDKYEEDAIDVIDAFLSRVERIVQTIHHTVPRTKTDDIDYARIIFDSGVKHIDPSHGVRSSTHVGDDNERSTTHVGDNNERALRTENTTQRSSANNSRGTTTKPNGAPGLMQCRGRGCTKNVEKFVLDRLGLSRPGLTTLCRECYLEVQRRGEVKLSTGTSPNFRVGRDHPQTQRAFALLGMTTTSKGRKQALPNNTRRGQANVATNAPLTYTRPIPTTKPKGKPPTPTTTKEQVDEEENDHIGSSTYEEGIETSFNHMANSASILRDDEEGEATEEYDATFCSIPQDASQRAHATKACGMTLELEDDHETIEFLIAPLNEQVHMALDENITEMHECVNEMQRAGWTRTEDESTLTISELHQNIDTTIGNCWETPILGRTTSMSSTTESTLDMSMEDEPTPQGCRQSNIRDYMTTQNDGSPPETMSPTIKSPNKANKTETKHEDDPPPHMGGEREVDPIVDANGMHSGYHITEPNGHKHTINLDKCMHTNCIRYSDNFAWAKYCDLCANLEHTESFTTKKCDECDITQLHDPKTPPTTKSPTDEPTSTSTRDDMVTAIIQGLLEVESEANTTHDLEEGEIQASTTTSRHLTWCDGEFWEGGCTHSHSPPEPITDNDGITIGRIVWNPDGTHTRIEYEPCEHECARYYDPINDIPLCAECHSVSLPPNEAQHSLTSCSQCAPKSETLRCHEVIGSPIIPKQTRRKQTTPKRAKDIQHRVLRTNNTSTTPNETTWGHVARKPVSKRDDEFIRDEWCWDSDSTDEGATPESPTWSEICDHDQRVDEEWEEEEEAESHHQDEEEPAQYRALLSTPGDTLMETTQSRPNQWFAKCGTKGCPCEASYNGQDEEPCSKHCRHHGGCKTNVHYYPRQYPRAGDARQPTDNIESHTTMKKMALRAQPSHPRTTPKSYHHSYCGTRGEPRV